MPFSKLIYKNKRKYILKLDKFVSGNWAIHNGLTVIIRQTFFMWPNL